MQFQSSLVTGILVQRYKRFLADIRLDQEQTIITAHCPNSGSMMGLDAPGNVSWLFCHPEESKRKLKYTWEMVQVGQTLVGINTHRTNKIVREALEAQKIVPFQGFSSLRSEVRYGTNSRIDFLLEFGSRNCFLEVKNVTLKDNHYALFPDAITTRGQKHLCELAAMVRQGHRAAILFVVQREDCSVFSIAESIDPLYARLFREVLEQGVEAYCYTCKISPKSVELAHPIKIMESNEPK